MYCATSVSNWRRRMWVSTQKSQQNFESLSDSGLQFRQPDPYLVDKTKKNLLKFTFIFTKQNHYQKLYIVRTSDFGILLFKLQIFELWRETLKTEFKKKQNKTKQNTWRTRKKYPRSHLRSRHLAHFFFNHEKSSTCVSETFSEMMEERWKGNLLEASKTGLGPNLFLQERSHNPTTPRTSTGLSWWEPINGHRLKSCPPTLSSCIDVNCIAFLR
jgi:hypothetical protein